MAGIPEHDQLIRAIAANCDISDGRDHSIYTMCTMVLELRNLFKWERGMEPWQEPSSAELLDWIEAKENHWPTVAEGSYHPLSLGGRDYQPFDLEAINTALAGSGLYYGAGYGRALKDVFFLAEIVAEKTVESCRVLLLGRELVREMAAPFAMLQDGIILIRREMLRFFFWDQLLEVRSSCRQSLRFALGEYGVIVDGVLDKERLRQTLDTMVEQETDLFIYHEVGEQLETALSSAELRALVARFPGSAVEYVGRALKDLLADTHPRGLLAHLIRERRQSSLAFYLAFADGLRQTVFPEIAVAWQRLRDDGDWGHIEEARLAARRRLEELAGHCRELAAGIDRQSDQRILDTFAARVLVPLGLDQGQG